MNKKELILTTIINKSGWIQGRLVSGSKTMYRRLYPDHEVYFNANIFINDGKVWFGDIDLTFDKEYLQNISNETNETLYILREFDGRFENENINLEGVKSKAVAIIEPI